VTYSCTDFTDGILNALGIVVPEENWDDPEGQADLALAEITRLQAIQPTKFVYLLVWYDDGEESHRVCKTLDGVKKEAIDWILEDLDGTCPPPIANDAIQAVNGWEGEGSPFMFDMLDEIRISIEREELFP